MVEITKSTYIDIHAHLSDERFDPTREDLINHLESFIVLNAGENREENIKVFGEFSKHRNVLPCIGLHPNDAVRLTEEQLSENLSYLNENIDKAFAVSEIGLDYKGKTEEDIDIEKKILGQILDLSEKHGKVCILHSRKSMGDLLGMLKSYKVKAILHNFEGNSTDLSTAIDIRAFISVSTGFLRFRRDSLLKKIPLDSLFFETDSPALSPSDDKNELNTPLNLIKVMQYFANLRGMSLDYLSEKIRSNFVSLFKLDV